MQWNKKEQTLLQKAIDRWEQNALIDKASAQKIRGDVSTNEGSNSSLSSFILIAAVSCGVLAFAALVIDEKWIELFRKQFHLAEGTIAAIFTIISILLAYYAYKKHNNRTTTNYSKEAFNITVVLSWSVALVYLGRTIGYDNGNYAPIIGLSAIVLGINAIVLRSSLIWICCLVTLCGWWAAQTYYWSGAQTQNAFWHMNYPVRMTVFCAFLLLINIALQKIKSLSALHDANYITSWILFLISAWTVSIFGNSANWETWSQLKQGKFMVWALAFTAMLILIIIYAIRKKEVFLRDVCLSFFILNLYTRFFEYFWNTTNKGIFFAILAVSFWLIGKKIEGWHKKQKSNTPITSSEDN
jgi:uncharacterized membrane protein